MEPLSIEGKIYTPRSASAWPSTRARTDGEDLLRLADAAMYTAKRPAARTASANACAHGQG
jgi:GGDEF domain-containing protein